jgi:hypothetical protein
MFRVNFSKTPNLIQLLELKWMDSQSSYIQPKEHKLQPINVFQGPVRSRTLALSISLNGSLMCLIVMPTPMEGSCSTSFSNTLTLFERNTQIILWTSLSIKTSQFSNQKSFKNKRVKKRKWKEWRTRWYKS